MYEALLKSSYLSSGHLPQQPLASCYCSSSSFLQKGQSTFSAFPILWSYLTTKAEFNFSQLWWDFLAQDSQTLLKIIETLKEFF